MDMSQHLRLRTSSLDELGDIYAEKGSRPWAIAVRQRTRSLIGDSQSNSMHVEAMVDVIKETEAYRVLEDRSGNPFTSYETFCVTPSPWGLGYPPGVIEHIIAERKQREVEDRAASMEGKRFLDVGPPTIEEQNNVDVINIRTLGGGTSADYLTARIARDRPDILERMKAGEYPSVRRAAIDAGIVKATVTHAISPSAFARAARKYLTDDQIDQMFEMLKVSEGA